MITKDNAGSVLTVDLQAIVRNWKLISSKLADGCVCGASIKSNAYGLGAVKVSNILAKNGCENFFVAYSFEGIKVRTGSKNVKNIFVFSGVWSGEEEDFFEHDLIPVINSEEQLRTWANFAKNKGKKLKTAFNIDSGLVRLGLVFSEFVTLYQETDLFDYIEPVLIISHLACSYDRKHPKNLEQLELFSNFAYFAKNTFPNIKTSLSNSAGIFLGQDFHFDVIRSGASLYGLSSFEDGNFLENTIELKSKILQIQEANPPQTIGYNATYKVKRKTKVASVAIGYGDGFFRSLSNKGYGYLKGQKVNIIGNISMDTTTFDITDIKEEVKVGDFIELISERNRIEMVGEKAGTIGAEMMSALGHRYYRYYIE